MWITDAKRFGLNSNLCVLRSLWFLWKIGQYSSIPVTIFFVLTGAQINLMLIFNSKATSPLLLRNCDCQRSGADWIKVNKGKTKWRFCKFHAMTPHVSFIPAESPFLRFAGCKGFTPPSCDTKHGRLNKIFKPNTVSEKNSGEESHEVVPRYESRSAKTDIICLRRNYCEIKDNAAKHYWKLQFQTLPFGFHFLLCSSSAVQLRRLNGQ